ncbi:MAG: MFS transporter [Candidatus Lokiarchaeota archaeon]|nr:MFS transporter [Candidatus Lokiarchaeota archaeon]
MQLVLMKKLSSLKILILLTFFSSALFSVITPMAKELSIALALESEEAISTINSIFLMVAAISSIFWALLGDKISRKILLIIATFEWSILIMLTTIAFDFFSLLLFQIFTAIGFGAALPLVFSLTVDFVEPEKRGKEFGLLSAIYVLGNGLGQVLSGFLIDAYPWQTPLIIVSVGGFICAGLLFFVNEPRRGGLDKVYNQLDKEQEKIDYKIRIEDIKKIGKIKSTIWILLFNFAMFIAIGSISSFFISMLKNDYLLSSTLATIFLIVVFGSQVPSGPIFGKLGDKLHIKDINGRMKIALICLSCGSILYIIGFSLFFISTSLISAFIFLIFAFSGAFLFGGIDPLTQATLGEVNPPQIRSTIYSINYLAYSFGRSISLILLGQFFLTFNNYYSPGYVLLAILALICSLFCIPIFKNLSKDMERINSGKS